ARWAGFRAAQLVIQISTLRRSSAQMPTLSRVCCARSRGGRVVLARVAFRPPRFRRAGFEDTTLSDRSAVATIPGRQGDDGPRGLRRGPGMQSLPALVLAGLAVAGSAGAASRDVKYAPQPAWVKPPP